MQSPIDLSSQVGRPMEKAHPLRFMYNQASIELQNNGKIVRGTVAGQNNHIHLPLGNPAKYQLKSIEFHVPSEHTLDGARSDAEVQLTHEGPRGALAVVSVLLNVAAELNPFMKQLWGHLPRGVNSRTSTGKADPNLLLPSGSFFAQKGAESYYSYTGSLTSPPCDEGVKWLVLKDQGVLSAEQLEMYRVVLNSRHLGEGAMEVMNDVLNSKDYHPGRTAKFRANKRAEMSNARPAQPLNGRQVFFDDMDAASPFRTVSEISNKEVKVAKRNVQSIARKDLKAIKAAKAAETVAQKTESKAAKDDKKAKKILKRSKYKEQKRVSKKVKAKVGKKLVKLTTRADTEIAKLKVKLKEEKRAMKKKVASVRAQDAKQEKVDIKKAVKKRVGAQRQSDTKAIQKSVVAARQSARILNTIDNKVKGARPVLNALRSVDPNSKSSEDLEEAAASQSILGTVLGTQKVGYVKLRKFGSTAVMKLATITNGAFEVHGVIPGTYTIESIVRGFQPKHTVAHVRTGKEPLRLSVHMGGVKSESQELGESASVGSTETQGRGQIYGAVALKDVPTGAADLLGYVKVRPCCQRTGKHVRMAVVQHGTFAVDKLPAGSYTLETNIPGHEAHYDDVVVEEESPKQLQVVV